MSREWTVAVSLLWIAMAACTNGGGEGPTAPVVTPTRAPVPAPAPLAVDYDVTAQSGSFEGTFDAAGAHFSGTVELRFRVTSQGEHWDFVILTSVALTKTGDSRWVGTYDTTSVTPVEVCPAAKWAENGNGFGNWAAMSMVRSGSRARVELEIESFVLPFSGVVSGGRLVTNLSAPSTYLARCTPLF